MNATFRKSLSNIMKTAHTFIKQNGMTLSQALKKAWANAKVVANMAKGVVRFEYIKISTGEHRIAYGTLQPSRLPETKGNRREYAHLQTYWDTIKQGWRSFCKAELVC